MSVKVAEEVSSQVPADDFQVLEDKVYRTIEMYKTAREGRAIAERDLNRIREQLEEREEEIEGLRREMVQLRRERRKSAAGLRRCCIRSKPSPRSRPRVEPVPPKIAMKIALATERS